MEDTTRALAPKTAGGNGAGETVFNKATANAHGVVDRLAGAADEATRKVPPAIDRVAQMAHQAVDKVADVAVPTANWLGETRDSLKATPRKMVADVGQCVSAHPWKSLGAALAAGFLISRFLR